MAENLMGFASSNGPYLHSNPYNFRTAVGQSLKQETSFNLKDITETINNLTKIEDELKAAADSFLSDWHGDYKQASKDLFLGGDEDTFDIKKQFRKIAIDVMNTPTFINLIQENSVRDYKHTFIPLLRKYGLKGIEDSINSNTSIEELVDTIMNQIVTPGKSTRIDLTGDSKAIIRELLNDQERQFAKNKKSLVKQLTIELEKKTKKISNTKVFNFFKKEFLDRVPNDYYNIAEEYLKKIRPLFVKRLDKITTIDFSNISGEIGENLVLSILGDNEFGLTFYDIGDLSEEEMLKEINKWANDLNLDSSQLQKNLKNGEAKKSGTDWIIVNKKGQMIRAQVKNSASIAEEIREKGSKGFPQTIKLQDKISYKTLKYNLQTYNGAGGMDSTDWVNLEYLMANVLWIRHSGGVTQDKGKDYSSGVSGIIPLIERILAKEIGYFLGVSLEKVDDNIATIIGASNVFFVIDDVLLYPTYKIIAAIKKQIEKINI